LEEFVRIMLQNFDKKVISNLEIDPNDPDLQDNLILASIVEKEEKSVKEKATVA
jgi:cell division protein YceG involved in septum cleavage